MQRVCRTQYEPKNSFPLLSLSSFRLGLRCLLNQERLWLYSGRLSPALGDADRHRHRSSWWDHDSGADRVFSCSGHDISAKNSGENEIQYESGSEIILHCLHFGESCTNIAKRLFRFQEKPFFRQDLHFFKGCIPPSAASAAEYQYLFIPSELIPWRYNLWQTSITWWFRLFRYEQTAGVILFQQLRESFSHWQCRCGCRYDILLKQTWRTAREWCW